MQLTQRDPAGAAAAGIVTNNGQIERARGRCGKRETRATRYTHTTPLASCFFFVVRRLRFHRAVFDAGFRSLAAIEETLLCAAAMNRTHSLTLSVPHNRPFCWMLVFDPVSFVVTRCGRNQTQSLCSEVARTVVFVRSSPHCSPRCHLVRATLHCSPERNRRCDGQRLKTCAVPFLLPQRTRFCCFATLRSPWVSSLLLLLSLNGHSMNYAFAFYFSVGNGGQNILTRLRSSSSNNSRAKK